MKKKIIITIIISVIILAILLFIGSSYKKYQVHKRYETIKIEIKEEATKYLKISHPYCTPGSGSFTMNEDTLLIQWDMDKKKLLDVDGKSYCKTRIEAMCVAENELDTNVYIKCKDYEDENYSNWEEREKNEKVTFNDKEQKIINLINDRLDIDKYFIKENLESFEIIKLQKFGYYESENHILYVTVFYKSKCIDNTTNCDRLDNYKEEANEENRPFGFLIKVDTKDYNYIEKINAFSAHINSDWKGESGRIE